MAESFEITDEMRSLIGVESEPWTYEVTTTSVRAFARGVGYTDPVYFDEAAARAAGYRSLPAPPTYLGTAVFIPGKSNDTFSGPRASGPTLNHGLPGLLDGGTETVYERPIVAGDVLSVTSKLADLETRRPRALGHHAGHDERDHLPRRRQRRGRRPPAGPGHLLLTSSEPLPADRSRSLPTVPNFADVNVGDALPELTKAPDRSQLVKYAAGSGDFNPLHFDPDFPQARQIGDNIVHGRMKYAIAGRAASRTGWATPAGSPRSRCQYRGMDLRGSTFVCKGRVVAKREEGGRKVVDLEVWTEDGSGNRTTPGTADGRPDPVSVGHGQKRWSISQKKSVVRPSDRGRCVVVAVEAGGEVGRRQRRPTSGPAP